MNIKRTLRNAVVCVATAGSLYAAPIWNGSTDISTKNVNIKIEQKADSARYSKADFGVNFSENQPFKIGSKLAWNSDMSFDATKSYAIEPTLRKQFKALDLGASYFYSGNNDPANETKINGYSADASLNFGSNKLGGLILSKNTKISNKSVITNATDVDSRKIGIDYLINCDDINLLIGWVGIKSETNVKIPKQTRNVGAAQLNFPEYLFQIVSNTDVFSLNNMLPVNSSSAVSLFGKYSDATVSFKENKVDGKKTKVNVVSAGAGFCKLSLDKVISNFYGSFTNENTREYLSDSAISKDKRDIIELGAKVRSEKRLRWYRKREFDNLYSRTMQNGFVLFDLENMLKRQDYLQNEGFEFDAKLEKSLKGGKRSGYEVKGMCALLPFLRVFGSYKEGINCDSETNQYFVKGAGLLIGKSKVNAELSYKNEISINEAKGRKVDNIFGISLNYGGGLK